MSEWPTGALNVIVNYNTLDGQGRCYVEIENYHLLASRPLVGNRELFVFVPGPQPEEIPV